MNRSQASTDYIDWYDLSKQVSIKLSYLASDEIMEFQVTILIEMLVPLLVMSRFSQKMIFCFPSLGRRDYVCAIGS